MITLMSLDAVIWGILVGFCGAIALLVASREKDLPEKIATFCLVFAAVAIVIICLGQTFDWFK